MPAPLSLADYIQGANNGLPVDQQMMTAGIAPPPKKPVPSPYLAMNEQPKTQDAAGTPAPGGMPLPPSAPPKRLGVSPPSSSTPTANLPVSDEDFRSAAKSLDVKGLESFQNQKAGINNLDDALAAARGKKTKLDLSSLLAYADQTYGGNLSKGYQKPQTQEELDKAANDLALGIQKSRGALSATEAELLRSRLGAEEKLYGAKAGAQAREDSNNQHAQSIALGRYQTWANHQDNMTAAQTKNDLQAVEHYTDKFNADPLVVEANKKVAEAGTAQELLDQALTNPAARQTAKLELARLVVPSRLNETEIASFGGSGKAQDKVNQIFTDMEKGTLTPENHKYLSEIVGALSKHSQKAVQDRLDHHAQQFAMATGKPKDLAKSFIGGTASSMPAPENRPQTVTQNGHQYTLNPATGEYE